MSDAAVSWADAKTWRETLRVQGRTVVFSNGCFDILHSGHIELLETARSFGDALILGLNSDAGVRRLKGDNRPLVPEADRARVMAALRVVDKVVIFDDDTPLRLIETLLPDIIVKGGDWRPENVVGKNVVEANGGRVEIVPLVEGRSTTSVIEEVLKKYCK